MENDNNGFVLSEELTALREQVRRIIRDEIIPIEKTPRSRRAPKFPKRTTGRSRAKLQAAGMWCMGAPTEIRRRRTRHLRHVRADGRDGAASDGPLQSGRRRVRAHAAAGHLRRHRRTDPEVRGARRSRTPGTLSSRLPSRRADPTRPARSNAARCARAIPTYSMAPRFSSSHAHEAEWGVVFTRTDPKAGRAGSPLHRHKGHPWLHRAAVQDAAHGSTPIRSSFRGLRDAGRAAARTRGRRADALPRFADAPALSVFGLQHRRRRGGAQDGDRACQAAQHLRRVAGAPPGDPMDARRFGGRAARGALADVGGRVEGRPRRRRRGWKRRSRNCIRARCSAA